MVKKIGYSLLEATIVMLIISVFVAVVANVIPRKVKPKTESGAHGRFECFYNASGELQTRLVVPGAEPRDETSSTPGQTSIITSEGSEACKFSMPMGVKFVVINAIGSGTLSSNGTNANHGKFISTFFNSTNTVFAMKPGKIPEEIEQPGNPTIVYDINREEEDPNLLEAGGAVMLNCTSDNCHDNISISSVTGCIAMPGFYLDESLNVFAMGLSCPKSPVCEVEGDSIKVSYCRTNELYKTVYIPWKKPKVSASSTQTNVLRDSQYIIDSPYTDFNVEITRTKPPRPGAIPGIKHTLTSLSYYDTSLWTDYGSDPTEGWHPSPETFFTSASQEAIRKSRATPSLYTLKIMLQTERGDAHSLMTNYLDAMQIDDGIGEVNPGDAGNDGAVLVIW